MESKGQWISPPVYGPGITPMSEGDPLRQTLEKAQEQMVRAPTEADKAAQVWALRRAELDAARSAFDAAQARLEAATKAEALAWERLCDVARPPPTAPGIR